MLMKIGEISKKTGIHIETIRYYEKMKLIPRPPRSEAGHRFYSTDQKKRLLFIRRARGLDFSLDEIRFLLQTAEADNPSCADVAKFSEKHLKLIQAKIRDLKDMEKNLTGLLKACDGNRAPGCPLIDVLFENTSR